MTHLTFLLCFREEAQLQFGNFLNYFTPNCSHIIIYDINMKLKNKCIEKYKLEFAITVIGAIAIRHMIVHFLFSSAFRKKLV